MEQSEEIESIKKQIEELRIRQREILEGKSFQLTFPLDPVSEKIIKDVIYLPITVNLPGSNAATASNYGVFFVNPLEKALQVVSIAEIHGTAGTDAGNVTLQVERLQGTEALDNGDQLLSSAFNLKGTANTVQYGDLVSNGQLLILGKGDRLALKDSGTLTSVADVCVTVIVKFL